MKGWFGKLNNSYKVAILSSASLVVLLCLTSFLYFINYPEFPNGLLLGGFTGIISYLLMGIAEDIDSKKQKMTLSIIMTVVRFLLVASVIVLVGYLYYKKNLHIFNLFTTMGGYFISLIILITLMLKEKKNV